MSAKVEERATPIRLHFEVMQKMSKKSTQFLGTTEEIRRELLDRVPEQNQLKLAVAFVTAEWMRVLGDFRGKGKLICWLTSGATDPEAIKRLMRPGSGFEVRHLHAMHAKVYLGAGPKPFAIVGSANLSSPALAGSDHSGNTEAAVLLKGSMEVQGVEAWFDQLWKKSRSIQAADLRRARRARAIAQRARRDLADESPARNAQILPPDWAPQATLLELASGIRRRRRLLRDDIPDISYLNPASMTDEDRRVVIGHLISWAHWDFKFEPAIAARMPRVRRAFRLAFDESVPIDVRLQRLNGSEKVPGLGLASWTMILYYWAPERYPPFNEKTRRFLRDYGLGTPQESLTPGAYAGWLDLCGELAVRLDLPSAGHIDRLVWEHSEGAGAEPRTQA